MYEYFFKSRIGMDTIVPYPNPTHCHPTPNLPIDW